MMHDELSVSPNRGGKVILRFEFNLHYPPPILTGETLQLPTKVELLLIMISVSECSLSTLILALESYAVFSFPCSVLEGSDKASLWSPGVQPGLTKGL